MKLNKDLVAAYAAPLVLTILGDGESYGYAILERVRTLSDGAVEWTDGMLYPVLHRLEANGYVASHWGVARNRPTAEVLRLEAGRSEGLDGPEGAVAGGGANAWTTLGGTDVEDIERLIERWRRGLSASLAGRPDVIDELEGHLRDDVARQVADGVPQDQAWATAVARLGRPDDLAAEFAKVPPRWLPGTVVPVIVLVAGLGFGGPIASRVWGRESGPLLAIHILTVTWGYLAALAAGVLAVWVVAEGAFRGDGRRGMAAFRRPASGLAWASLLMTAVGVVLGAVWASGQLGRAWDWDPREVGGLGVLVCAGLSLVVVRLNSRAGMAVAIAGSMAAVLAWFVPPLLETGGAFAVGLGVVLGAVVGGQLVLMALAVAHPRAWGMANPT